MPLPPATLAQLQSLGIDPGQFAQSGGYGYGAPYQQRGGLISPAGGTPPMFSNGGKFGRALYDALSKDDQTQAQDPSSLYQHGRGSSL